MRFETKMSGTKVTDYEITPVCADILPLTQIDTFKTETAQWILDNFYLIKLSESAIKEYGCNHVVALDWDSVMKISILEKYPEYEKEMIEYFGERWLRQYIRFNH